MSEDIPVVVPDPVPNVVSFDDIMNDHAILLQRESDTKELITSQLLELDAMTLKPKLLEWASLRLPDMFTVLTVSVDVPTTCSDGVSRPRLQYLEFCSGISISDILASISSKLPGMTLSYSYTLPRLSILVSKN